MAFQQSDLDAVERAIASGELSVSDNGRTVTYRSMSDLMKARDLIRRSLQSAQQPTIGGLRYSLARFDR